MSNIITTNGNNINTANGEINTGSGAITTTGALSCGEINTGSGAITTTGALSCGSINAGSGAITTTGALSCGAITPNYTTLPTFANTQIGYTKKTIGATTTVAAGNSLRFYITKNVNGISVTTAKNAYDTVPIGVYLVYITFQCNNGNAGADFELNNDGLISSFSSGGGSSSEGFAYNLTHIFNVTSNSSNLYVSLWTNSDSRASNFINISIGVCRIA